MRVFVVVGGIAAGKTTVCRLLAERQDAVIVDADRIGHRVLESRAIRQRLVERFGDALVRPDGQIDRRRLGKRVFSDVRHRQWLDALVHPEIGRRIRRRLRDLRRRGTGAAVLDAALYFEVRLGVEVDAVLAVTAPRSVRRRRLAARDDLSMQQIEARLASQPGVASWTRKADVVLDTNIPRDALPARVDAAWRALQRCARQR
jgi:dephospho-CoA kinase